MAPETVTAIERARAASKSLWRVSSTCFYHINSDVVLEPEAHFATLPTAGDYPAIDAGEQVRRELELIKLGTAPQAAVAAHAAASGAAASE